MVGSIPALILPEKAIIPYFRFCNLGIGYENFFTN